ncbi:hypothetical protein GCM10018954_101740 [Kutzneria kofuensis]
MPYVVVIMDRIGADLRGYSSSGETGRQGHCGREDFPVHKVAGTGWSHLKMQHRVENTARDNAGPSPRPCRTWPTNCRLS